jgi:hypothetical protein
MNIRPMDYVRAALYNAAASGLTFADIVEAAVHADTPQDFDNAVNMLGLATSTETDEAQPNGSPGCAATRDVAR